MTSRWSFDPDALGRTVTLKNSRFPPFSQRIRLVSPGAFPLITISVRLTAVASAKPPNPTETLSTGCAQSSTTDLPTTTERSLAASCRETPEDCGLAAAPWAYEVGMAHGASSDPLRQAITKYVLQFTLFPRGSQTSVLSAAIR